VVLPDNHNHFIFHGSAREMVAAAAAAGVGEIAFTEHVFHIEEARVASPYIATRFTPEGPPVDHASYLAAIAEAQANAPVAVRVGIELDVRADDLAMTAATDAFCADLSPAWDIVIGSVHVIAGDVAVEGEGAHPEPEAAWADYLDRLVAAAASGRYDVISHPARLARSAPDAPPFVARRYRELAAAAAAGDVALEVNGTDLERHPDLVRALVAACAAEGAIISLGSDAHRPNNAGRVLGSRALLREHGITAVAAFRSRVRTLVPIR
jgi:histidinol-phosphatase (PHP family)